MSSAIFSPQVHAHLARSFSDRCDLKSSHPGRSYSSKRKMDAAEGEHRDWPPTPYPGDPDSCPPSSGSSGHTSGAVERRRSPVSPPPSSYDARRPPHRSSSSSHTAVSSSYAHTKHSASTRPEMSKSSHSSRSSSHTAATSQAQQSLSLHNPRRLSDRSNEPSSSKDRHRQPRSPSPSDTDRHAHYRSRSSAHPAKGNPAFPPPLPERPSYYRSHSSSNSKTHSYSHSQPSPPPPETMTKQKLPKEKLRALDNFAKLGRRHKENEKKPHFPPSSWFPEESTNGSGSQRRRASESSGELDRLEGITEKPLPPAPPPSDNEGDRTPTNDRRGSSEPGSPADETYNAPEPLTLARRIQVLLLSIPTSSAAATATPEQTQDASSPPTSDEPVTPRATQAPELDTSHAAPPPPPPVPLTDHRLFSFLSNGTIMNGSLEKGRQSVFAILDRLRPPMSRPPSSIHDATPSNQEDGGNESDDNSSIMLYGPLVPSDDSEVEIARSDIVSVCEDGEERIEYERPAHRISMLVPYDQYQTFGEPLPSEERDKGKGKIMEEGRREEKEEEKAEAPKEKTGVKGGAAWKWFDTWKVKALDKSRWKGKGKAKATELEEQPPEEHAEPEVEPEAEMATLGEVIIQEEVTFELGKEAERPEEKPIRTRVVWVPSSEKISFQATWWGYRLYLPPPILDVLNNKRLVAAKRAALITTALKWLLDHVPLTVVPPQFRPGLMVAQRLVPYLGYVGAFLAWSWGAIKSFDKGYGVVLTATWLLPLALVPGTWELSDFDFPADNATNIDDNNTVAGPSNSAH